MSVYTDKSRIHQNNSYNHINDGGNLRLRLVYNSTYLQFQSVSLRTPAIFHQNRHFKKKD